MKHIKFTTGIIIQCSAATAFDYTQDYNRHLGWDRFLKKAELIDRAHTAGIRVKAGAWLKK